MADGFAHELKSFPSGSFSIRLLFLRFGEFLEKLEATIFQAQLGGGVRKKTYIRQKSNPLFQAQIRLVFLPFGGKQFAEKFVVAQIKAREKNVCFRQQETLGGKQASFIRWRQGAGVQISLTRRRHSNTKIRCEDHFFNALDVFGGQPGLIKERFGDFKGMRFPFVIVTVSFAGVPQIVSGGGNHQFRDTVNGQLFAFAAAKDVGDHNHLKHMLTIMITGFITGFFRPQADEEGSPPKRALLVQSQVLNQDCDDRGQFDFAIPKEFRLFGKHLEQWHFSDGGIRG